MNEIEKQMIERLNKYIMEKNVSNDFLVQLIEVGKNYLNLQTIPDYCKFNKISYNGAKNHRQIIKLFNKNFVIDNS